MTAEDPTPSDAGARPHASGGTKTGIVAAVALIVGVSAGYIGAQGLHPQAPAPLGRPAPPGPPPADPMHHAGPARPERLPQGMEGHPPPPHEMTPPGPFTEANARMHRAMAVPPTGDVDLDFARSMVPHHEGAVEMARIQLREGKDPEMRRLAEQVVSSQEAEIATMKAWIAERQRRSAR